MAPTSGWRTRYPGVGGLILAAAAAALMLLPASALAGGFELIYDRDPVEIPDGQGAARIKLETAVGGVASAVQPNFRVNHEHTQQLKLMLKGPDGEKVVLSDRETHGKNLGGNPCGEDPNLVGYTGFRDDETSTLADGAPPFTGYSLPNEPLAPFVSAPVDGPWTLIVKDTKEGTKGSLRCGLMVLLTS